MKKLIKNFDAKYATLNCKSYEFDWQSKRFILLIQNFPLHITQMLKFFADCIYLTNHP